VSDERKVAVASPIALLKACKNAAEIAGMRDAHVRAGAVPSFAQTSRRKSARPGACGLEPSAAAAMLRFRLDRAAPQRPPPPCTESRRGALLGCGASLAHAVHAAGRGVPGESRSRRLGACDRQAWVR
jgi:Xaa-Pro aminopeptidase